MRYIDKLSLLVFFLMSSVCVSAQSVIGKWKTIDDETNKPKSIVEVYNQNGKIYGRIVALFRSPGEDQDPVCTECKGAKNGEKIKGMVIMEGLSKDGAEYEDGTILDPNNGKIYDCKIWLDGNDKLMVRGYVGIFFRTQEWIRVPE